jgi:hypothetical protein
MRRKIEAVQVDGRIPEILKAGMLLHDFLPRP